MNKRDISIKELLFAQRIASIGFFEWGKPENNASCLVLGDTKEADALEALLTTRCKSADSKIDSEKTYDIIFLTEQYDIPLLKNIADRDTLVVDAAMSGKVRYFDPSLPFRQVRVISLSLAEENTDYGCERTESGVLMQESQ